MKEHDCDILVITETWYYENETVYFGIDGYNGVHSCRETRGGGTSIYVKSSIRYCSETVSNKEKTFNYVSIDLVNNDV